jgi:hypothetical protein
MHARAHQNVMVAVSHPRYDHSRLPLIHEHKTFIQCWYKIAYQCST